MAMTGISANRLELLQIADAVAREKTIDKKIVIEAMEDAIQKAAKSRYGAENDIRCEIDLKTGEARLTRVLAVVDEVVRQIEASFKIALTGTPVENRLQELWSILEFFPTGCAEL